MLHEVTGTKIRKARTKLGLTQAELARRAGVSRATVVAIERGDSGQVRTVRALVTVLLEAAGVEKR